MDNMVKIALRFRSDLAELIEADSRRILSYGEDLTIEAWLKMVRR